MSVPGYESYRDSGVEWLGEVPSHWEVRRLKHVADAFPSNVDKKSYDEDTPVRLCNYTDVYYNDVISDDPEFMAATATSEQIAKFTLRADDTIITKDSETADDIASAAYVPADMPGVVCGYHLSMIRPHAGTSGAFIKRYFDSAFAKASVAVRANGLTRVGLGQYAVDNLDVPTPPLSEQIAIAAFLDRETAKIDALVEAQRRLIELLNEKRQAVISHAVTKGLDPAAPMKDSGVEWLGEVPAHWEVAAIKRYFTSLDGKRVPLSSEERGQRSGPYPYYGASGIIDAVDDFLFDEELVLVSEDGANLVNRSTPIAFVASGRYWVNNHAHVLQPVDGNAAFWAERIEAVDLVPFVTGAAQPKLTADALFSLVVAVPASGEERSAIEQHILSCKAALEPLVVQAEAAIALLQERRAALISAAVTGKIDVRGLAPQQAEAA